MTKSRFSLSLLLSLVCGAIAYYLYAILTSASQDILRFDLLPLSALLVLLMTMAVWRGWRYSSEGVALIILLISVALVNAPVVRNQFYTPIFVPAVVAAILLTPAWSLAIFVATLAGLAAVLSVQLGSAAMLGPTFAVANVIIEVVTTCGVVLSSALARQLQRTAEHNAQLAIAAQAQAEQKAADLARANAQMNVQLDEQRQLLELVASLETPVAPLADGVILAPVVGHLDTRRAEALTSRLLQQVSSLRAQLVVLDIAGVPLIDDGVAHSLIQMAQALRLLGCQVVFSGISAQVALALTAMNISLDGIATVRSPQDALAIQIGA